MQNKKPSMGRVWVFSGTAHSPCLWEVSINFEYILFVSSFQANFLHFQLDLAVVSRLMELV